jgi:type VI secretion system protein ImpA
MPSTPTTLSALLAESSTLVGGACGPNLEYTSSFVDFMTSAQIKEERQVGDAIISAQEPDWHVVMQAGMTLARESRDLRIAVTLTHAATKLHGLRGFTDGLALIHDWLSRHWDALHPTLVSDGEYDPLMRMNALSYLLAPDGCVKALRQARLLESRAGVLHVGDAENILLGRPIGSKAAVSTPEQLARLVADERERNAEAFASLNEALRLLQEIESLWKDRLETEYWPEFQGLREMLGRLAGLAATHHQDTEMPDNTLPPPSGTASEAPAERSPLPGAVHSRRDAFLALSLARHYFERNEPSHPAPLLIRRIEKLENLGFAEILAELAPDALGQIRQVTGNGHPPN